MHARTAGCPAPAPAPPWCDAEARMPWRRSSPVEEDDRSTTFAVVDAPSSLFVYTHMPTGHDGAITSSMHGPRVPDFPACIRACAVAVSILVFVAVMAGLFVFLHQHFPSKDPVLTMAITGVAGLDPAHDVDPPSPAAAAADHGHSSSSPPAAAPKLPARLSPVFDLTFEIDNTRNACDEACVPGLSTAAVSYGDAYLAGGSVPPFCAGTRRRRDGAAWAWGDNVAVPRFLRDQLAAELPAGDAAVDVKLTVKSFCHEGLCGTAVLSFKPKIGGGTSPLCRVDFL